MLVPVERRAAIGKASDLTSKSITENYRLRQFGVNWYDEQDVDSWRHTKRYRPPAVFSLNHRSVKMAKPVVTTARYLDSFQPGEPVAVLIGEHYRTASLIITAVGTGCPALQALLRCAVDDDLRLISG